MATCRDCGKKESDKRILLSVRRYGGGNYRRPGRVQHSSICVECAMEMEDFAKQTEAEGRQLGYQQNGFTYDSVLRALACHRATNAPTGS